MMTLKGVLHLDAFIALGIVATVQVPTADERAKSYAPGRGSCASTGSISAYRPKR